VSVPGGEFEVRSDQVAAVGKPLLAAAEPLDEAVQRRRVDDGIPALVGRRGGIPADTVLAVLVGDDQENVRAVGHGDP